MNVRLGKLAGLAISASAALCACEEVVPTTQIVVVVQAEDSLRDEIVTLAVATSHGSVQLPRAGEALTFPLSFSLVPADEELLGRLTVEARDDAGGLLAQRELDLTFRSRRTLSYGLLLGEECAGILTCPDAQTCDGCGQCVDTLVPAEMLVPLRHAADAIGTWEPALRCDALPDDAGADDP